MCVSVCASVCLFLCMFGVRHYERALQCLSGLRVHPDVLQAGGNPTHRPQKHQHGAVDARGNVEYIVNSGSSFLRTKHDRPSYGIVLIFNSIFFGISGVEIEISLLLLLLLLVVTNGRQ